VVFGDYEWDADKADANFEKHGVSFVEAASALQDPNAVYLETDVALLLQSAPEERHVAIGISAGARGLCVVHVERGDRDRIISARLATEPEEQLYSQG
jgi:uncharacterized DUF497 family protein